MRAEGLLLPNNLCRLKPPSRSRASNGMVVATFLIVMRQKIDNHITFRYRLALFGTITLLCLISLFLPQTTKVLAQQTGSRGGQSNTSKPVTSTASPVITGFNERVKSYIKLRGRLSHKADKPSDESKPTDIEAYQIALAEHIKVARANAKPGEFFTPDIARHIRQIIRNEFKGERLKELRATSPPPNAKGVPLRVNAPYPDAKELVEMPPTLLLKLPELPKHLRYRFLGRHLLLMDEEARLTIDYLLNVLP